MSLLSVLFNNWNNNNNGKGTGKENNVKKSKVATMMIMTIYHTDNSGKQQTESSNLESL